MPFKVQVGPPQISIHQGQTVLISRAYISSKVTVEHVHELGKGEQHVEGEPGRSREALVKKTI